MNARNYRYAATGVALLLFLFLSGLYVFDSRDLYANIFRWYGFLPYRSPFLDATAWLAVWECARQGIDVISANPCDVLQRGYGASPLWIAASLIPLGVRDTGAVGWILDLVFLVSLSLLPAPRCASELLITLGATLSTMVVFALERANPDVLVFLMTLTAGILAECGLFTRMLGYSVALVAALLKYYPIMALVIVFREGVLIFAAVSTLILCCLGMFFAEYHSEIARGLPSIARGAYNTDLFAAKNLPFLLGEAAGSSAEPSSWASAVQWMVSAGIYAILLGGSLRICGKLLGVRELRDALGALAGRERLFLVIGSAVIAGCFLAGQSTGYRGVFFLLTIPGLLAVSRTPCYSVRKLSLRTAVVIVLVMWSECFRHGLDLSLDTPAVSQTLAGYLKILFWLFRELAWWWIIGVMLTVLVDFVSASPIVRRLPTGIRRPLADTV